MAVSSVLLVTVAVVLGLLLLLRMIAWLLQMLSVQGRAVRRAAGRAVLVGFFHPYCDAGGGGERVLWVAINALVAAMGDRVHIVVYTGDTDATGPAILARAHKRFNLAVSAQHVSFVFLRRRGWVEAERYPRLTMLGQSLGSLVLGWEALTTVAPDVMIDSMGYAFTFPIFAVLGGCQVRAPSAQQGIKKQRKRKWERSD